MVCSVGRVAIATSTRDRLFAFSGGICAKCRGPLFADGPKRITIADQAHIVGASGEGPRGESHLGDDARSLYENLVLLCPNCHRQVDRLPGSFPVSLLTRWKTEVEAAVHRTFGEEQIVTRSDLAGTLRDYLATNHAVWKAYGPDSAAARGDVQGEAAWAWDRKVKQVILPNNLLILQVVDTHRSLLSAPERGAVEEFRQHVDDLAARHLDGVIESSGARFPRAFVKLVEILEAHDEQ